jgi:hypothetical protein
MTQPDDSVNACEVRRERTSEVDDLSPKDVGECAVRDARRGRVCAPSLDAAGT